MVKEGEGFSGANYLKQRRSGLIARREKGEVFVYLFGALVDVKLGIFCLQCGRALNFLTEKRQLQNLRDKKVANLGIGSNNFFLTNINVTTTIPLRDKVNPKDHQYKIERLPHMSLASESQKIRLAPNLAAPQPWFSTTQPSYPPPTHPKPSYSQNFQQRETLKVWRWFIVLEKWFTPVSKRVGRRVLNGTYSKYWSHWPEWHIQKARRLHHLHWQWGHHHGHVILTNCVQLGPFEVGLSLS